MIKVLMIESRDKDILDIEKKLSKTVTETYQLQCLNQFDATQFENLRFDILLLGQSENQFEGPRGSIDILKSALKLQFHQPIIYLTDQSDIKVDQQVMQLGADDCLPKNELTSTFLDRTIQHAIRRRKAESKIAHMATHDQLTGLANRYLLYQHLEHSISIAKRNDRQFAVLFIDLDKFKLINDSLGHDIGDILLVQVAERLTTCVRETDIVARFGNDEFAILMENTGPTRNIITIAQKIQKAMEPGFEVRQHELFISASMGIATFPECGIEPETLLKNADSALYKAKELGRNTYHFFTRELNKQARLKLELEKNLRRALINGEFDIHLQPQMLSHSDHVAGAEALLRWNHPKYGFISPAVFIPLLEDLGLLVGVEGWVLNQVCQLAKKFTDTYGQLRFSVNISGAHFKTGNLKENVYLALQASSLDAHNLEVELTEDIMIEHVEHNSYLLSELKEIGISVALDDFGKGYSSLSYLKNFPADILKIDKAFIDHLVEDKRDSAIVESLVDLSHKLGIKVVAEGVEQKGQLSHLKRIGCDFIQGYYFAKPMPINEFETFVVNRFEQHNKARKRLV
ncbi:putative bifunctional diguanylate cyclase/phosphodiesterase [Aliikangiella coralliicola]|uniref:EAL domain-containing protein n=1 Tax=Aliikangiella coralliicola TaxID=2592383 RepID=A0A545UG19_9GAMM|nr:EAL domain-containing protein [Aliikangiella coralliicola]TQV88424.1 EAL domain-containing protein [Aliikangiella coralliicola]